MMHVIADRWAEFFAVSSVVDAILEWLCLILAIGLLSSLRPTRYLRVLLTPTLLVLWLWMFACLSSGREFRNHHPGIALWMGLAVNLCFLISGLVVISLISLTVAKFTGRTSAKAPQH
ncbi:MAG TPA: hypothetical protein VGM51_09205 [Armatimonadota bacterium]|jgi:hypothetical protein